jgi:hypothetical protein
MASFSQLIGRLRAEQRPRERLNLADLGVDVEEEKQEVEAARAQYRRDLAKAQAEMQRRAEKRARRGSFGRLLGTFASFIPGLNIAAPLVGAAVGGIASGIGRSSVSPYKGTISTSLPGGKFLRNQRNNLALDIDLSNTFIRDAARSTKQAFALNVIGDALGAYQLSTALGAGQPKPPTETETGPEDETKDGKVEEKKLGAPTAMTTIPTGSLLGDVNLLGDNKPSTYDYQVGGPDGITLTAPFVDPFERVTDDEGNVDMSPIFDASYLNRIFGNDRRNY